MSASGVQLGDLATWVGGLATAGAFILTYLLLRVTRQEQRAIHAERRKEQARKISIWCASVEPSSGRQPDRVTVVLSNASDEMISGVRAAVGTDWWSFPNIKYVELDLPFVIPPGYRQEHEVLIRVGRTQGGQHDECPPVEVIFADATGGRYWRRDLYGGLSEIVDGLPPSGSIHFFRTPANLFPTPRVSGMARLRNMIGRQRSKVEDSVDE